VNDLCSLNFIVIVIVNSRFLQCPQKRSRGNQLIYRHLSKTKSIGSKPDPVRQADSQTAIADGVWNRDGEEGRERMNKDRIKLLKSSVFSLE